MSSGNCWSRCSTRRASAAASKHANDRRTVVDAMLYIAQTGCQWRYLPESFGPWTGSGRSSAAGRATAPGRRRCLSCTQPHARRTVALRRRRRLPVQVLQHQLAGLVLVGGGGHEGVTNRLELVLLDRVSPRPPPARSAATTTSRSAESGGTTSSWCCAPSGTPGASRSPTDASDAPPPGEVVREHHLLGDQLAPGRLHRHDPAPPVTATSPPAPSRARSLTMAPARNAAMVRTPRTDSTRSGRRFVRSGTGEVG